MRDAVGSVDFRGNDVDVALTSGATFLPDGGEVSASNGIFTIRNANKPQVIGNLELDIAGDASAITQLASYEPIDAMSRTGMTPDQFSGEVAAMSRPTFRWSATSNSRNSTGWSVSTTRTSR